MLKRCYKCKLEKNTTNFNKDCTTKDGFCRKCKDCEKLYRNDNKEHIAQASKNHYLQNKDSIKIYYQKYYLDNKGKIDSLQKDYYLNNKESVKEYHQIYYLNNKEKIRREQTVCEKNRLKSDINFKLIKNIRRRLSKAIENNQKAGSAVSDLGCSINFLKGYLEVQFYDNPETGEMMTWENYGFYGWHIDHIRPLSSFNLENREEFLLANHFSNLQPLWAKDNLNKSATIIQ